MAGLKTVVNYTGKPGEVCLQSIWKPGDIFRFCSGNVDDHIY